MPTYHPALDTAEVLDWQVVGNGDVQWRGLLIGNGASIAVAAYRKLDVRSRAELIKLFAQQTTVAERPLA